MRARVDRLTSAFALFMNRFDIGTLDIERISEHPELRDVAAAWFASK